MPEGPDGKTIIIVKKVSGHGGHHGGAWKVAYADFVTAMMALFMVLWLVNSASEPTRQRIASYFRKPGIFQKGSGTPMEMGGGGILPDVFSPPAEGNSTIQASNRIYKVNAETGKVRELYDEGAGSKDFQHASKVIGQDDTGSSKNGDHDYEFENKSESLIVENEKDKLERLKTDIEKAIESNKKGEESTEGVLGDIEIKIDQRGLVIEIMDTDKVSMFTKGQSVILPDAKSKLTEIAEILKTVPNPIDIEGHTDSTPFKGGRELQYDNWNLSTDRANAARRVLQTAGFEKGKIARVVGYADERPRDVANTSNPANRRITLSMRYSDRAKVALEGTFTEETNTKNKVSSETPEKANGRLPELKGSSVIQNGEDDGDLKKGDSFFQASEPLKKDRPLKEDDTESGGVKDVPEVKPEPVKAPELKVEISTKMPEGAISVSRPRVNPAGDKKTLIFDSPESFFKK